MYFKHMEKYGYEQLVLIQDKKTNLKGVIAIHDTNLGPSLGGVRLWNYKNEEEAIFDALRLARGMTYKSAAAGLSLGGGKAVLIGDPNTVKSEAYFKKFGEFVNNLGGKYITAEDMNTTTEDMAFIKTETDFVTGLEGMSGDPSPITAKGSYYAIKASLKHYFDDDSVKNRSFAVQGVGATGANIIRELIEEGATNIYFSEINDSHANDILEKYPNLKQVDNETLFKLDVDVLVPCAMGGVLNDETIPALNTKIICGTANNVLLDEDKHSKMLKDQGILYAPDFIVNAGGIINVYHEFIGYELNNVLKDVYKIYDRILEIFKISKDNDINTQEAAMLYANKMLEKKA